MIENQLNSRARFNFLRGEMEKSMLIVNKNIARAGEDPQSHSRRSRILQAGGLVRQRQEAYIEPRTGLWTRDYFVNITKLHTEQIDRYPSSGLGLRFVMFDLDNFGSVNGIHGELVGDLVLKTVGEVTRNTIRRATDTAARWGGEELVAILPFENRDTDDMAGQLNILENLRQQIAQISIDAVDNKLMVSASIGTTVYRVGEKFEEYFHRADLAMRVAKLLGKNRTVDAKFDYKGNSFYIDQTNGHKIITNFDTNHEGVMFDCQSKMIYNVTKNPVTGKSVVSSSNPHIS